MWTVIKYGTLESHTYSEGTMLEHNRGLNADRPMGGFTDVIAVVDSFLYFFGGILVRAVEEILDIRAKEKFKGILLVERE